MNAEICIEIGVENWYIVRTSIVAQKEDVLMMNRL